jgi:hypothetical protein
MKTFIILRVLLALHITSLVIMAGTTAIDYITFRTFWEFADKDDPRARGLLPMMEKYGAVVRAGGAMLLITGIAMLAWVDGVWWHQRWFKIKMVLVALLLLNGVIVGNKHGVAFRKQVDANTTGFMQSTSSLRITLNRFYIRQLTLFFIIVLISAIKFD